METITHCILKVYNKLLIKLIKSYLFVNSWYDNLDIVSIHERERVAMGFGQRKSSLKKQQGIGILEMALMILVLGMTSVVAIALYDRYEEFNKQETNKARVERVQAALDSFVNQNGRLPAPAPIDARPDTATYGSETSVTNVVTAANVGAGVAGTTVANGTGGRLVRIGTIPVRSLNLADEYMLDAWGNRMVYAVTQDYIVPPPAAPGVSAFAQDFGAITIQDAGDAMGGVANNSTAAQGNVIYAIVAPGSDKRGAYSADGLVGVPCGGPNHINNNCFDDPTPDATFVNTLAMKGDASTATGFAHSIKYKAGKDKFTWRQECNGPCSATCGVGVENCTYRCRNASNTEDVTGIKCLTARPADDTRSCDEGACAWRCGPYSTECRDPADGTLVTCGNGEYTCTPECRNARRPVPAVNCPGPPPAPINCTVSSGCTYHWDHDAWGACVDGTGAPVTCGNGTQTRNVWCVRDIDNVAVPDVHCDPLTRPASSQPCSLAACVCPAAPAVCPPNTMYNDAGGNPVCPCPAVCGPEPANCPDGTFYNNSAGNPVCPCTPSVCGPEPAGCVAGTFYPDSKGVARCPCTGTCPPPTCTGDNCPVVGVCFLETTNWADPATYGVVGGTKSASRTCTPPAGYTITATKMYANLDDGGTISVGGTTLFNDPWNDCAIGVFSPQIIPNLPAGGATLDIQSRNCGLAGVGGWAYIGFYGHACNTPPAACLPGPYRTFASAGEVYPDMAEGQFIDAAEQSSVGIQPGNFNVTAGDEVQLTYTGGTTPFRSYVYIYTIAADNTITILNKPLAADPANPNQSITLKIEQPASMAAFNSPAVKMGLLLLPNRLNAGTINGRLDAYYNHMQSGQRTARVGDTFGNLSLVYTPNSGNFGYEPAVLLTHERGGTIIHPHGLAAMVSAPDPADPTRLRVSFEDFPGGPGYAGSDGDANDVQLQVRIRPLAAASAACPQYYWGNLNWGLCTDSTGSINSCGDGNRNRAIGCVKDDGTPITNASIVNQINCAPETRPLSTEPCKISNASCGIQPPECRCGAAPACGVTYPDSCGNNVCYERCNNPVCTCDPGAATGQCGGTYNDSCGNPTCPNPNTPTCGAEPPGTLCGTTYADSCGNAGRCSAQTCGTDPNYEWTWGVQCTLTCGGNCIGVGTPENDTCARRDLTTGAVTQWQLPAAFSEPECTAIDARRLALHRDCIDNQGPAYGLTGNCCP